jgi:hypothetical protein
MAIAEAVVLWVMIAPAAALVVAGMTERTLVIFGLFVLTLLSWLGVAWTLRSVRVKAGRIKVFWLWPLYRSISTELVESVTVSRSDIGTLVLPAVATCLQLRDGHAIKLGVLQQLTLTERSTHHALNVGDALARSLRVPLKIDTSLDSTDWSESFPTGKSSS